MGAFDFATGSLSSLASAFAIPKGPGRNKINLNDHQLELDEPGQRVFTEFFTGMKMLYKHSIHNRFNLHSVTEQNLKLLHNNLKTVQAYKKTINKIRSRSVESSHWAWLPLFSNKGLNAGLLYLPAGHTVAPNIAGANVTIHQNTLQTPFSGSNSYSAGHQLYLGLMGATSIECEPVAVARSSTYSRAAEWDNFNQRNSMTVNIRRDDTFVADPLQAKVHRLSSNQIASLILNVHFTP